MRDGAPTGASMLRAPVGAAGESPPRPYAPEKAGSESGLGAVWGWMGEEGWPTG